MTWTDDGDAFTIEFVCSFSGYLTIIQWQMKDYIIEHTYTL